MSLPRRKNIRLKNFDYSSDGAYFITICVKERRKILSNIVGTGVPDCPQVILLSHGIIAEKYINQLGNFYENISIDKYIIMPDHIHLLLSITSDEKHLADKSPKKANNTNSLIPKFISSFKRFCNKEYGENIWQQRYYDHVVRNQDDYIEILEYIENNPINWVLTKSQDI